MTNGILRTISEKFDAAGVRCDTDYQPPVTGERRYVIEQYYHSIEWNNPRSVQPVLEVFESELRDLFLPSTSLRWDPEGNKARQQEREAIANRLIKLLGFDGFTWTGSHLVRADGTPVLEELTASSRPLEGAHLTMQIQRMRDSVDSDPSLAIGTAKELIETVCKTILEERGQTIDGAPEIPQLTKSLLKELELVPEGVPEQKRGADIIRGILRSLGTIGNDLAQLRGLYGTGHGKVATTQALQPRHAKLAVGAAATLVTFLVETHRQFPKRDAEPQ